MSWNPNQPSGPEQPPYYEYSPGGTPYSSGGYGPTSNAQDPYGGYGAYPPYGAYGTYTAYTPPPGPLPLGEAIKQLPRQYLKVTTKPGANTLAEEMGKAEWGIILVQLFGSVILGAILGFLASLITQSSELVLIRALGGDASSGNFVELLVLSPVSILTSIVTSLASFFIGQGIFFGLAKAFGGQGTFTAQAYTCLLFQVPLRIITSLLAFIPIVGGLAGFVLGVYQLILDVFAIMAVHRLSGGKATAVVLIPVGAVILLACLGIFLFVILFAATLRQVP